MKTCWWKMFHDTQHIPCCNTICRMSQLSFECQVTNMYVCTLMCHHDKEKCYFSHGITRRPSDWFWVNTNIIWSVAHCLFEQLSWMDFCAFKEFGDFNEHKEGQCKLCIYFQSISLFKNNIMGCLYSFKSSFHCIWGIIQHIL